MNKIIDSLLEYNRGDLEETAEHIKMLYQIAKLKADDIMFEWITVCGENDKCPECGADMEYIVGGEEYFTLLTFDCPFNIEWEFNTITQCREV